MDCRTAQPRVTAGDPVKEVGGKDGGGGGEKRREGDKKRAAKANEGFLFQISADPQGTSALAASPTKINHSHERRNSDHPAF